MNKKDIKLLLPWNEIESSAIDQIMKVAGLDQVIDMAIMPDVHMGYDMPIGGVALLDNHISPSFVGYDIGCGMCYVDTKIPASDILMDEREKGKIFNDIIRNIPMGVGQGNASTKQKWKQYTLFKNSMGDKELDKKIAARLITQLGSLGGGNHFIELGINKAGYLTITIHSGSRGPGWGVAQFYMNKAKDFNAGLIPIDIDLGKAYINDMNFFLTYALANRSKMMEAIMKLIGLDFGRYQKDMINKTHNHAEITEDGVLHRKGATSSYKDEMGIIPGSMKDGVYVVKGLGNSEFLNSSSHGAGRKMSRKKAKENIDMRDFQKEMTGIVAKVDRSTLDESPFAYKNIHTVIKKQDGIVIDVMDSSKPLVNVKA